VDHGRRACADAVTNAATRHRTTFVVLGLARAVAGCSGEPATEPAEAPPFPSQRAAFPVGSRALGYVTNGASDTLSVVDLEAMTTLASVPIGLDPIDPDGPSDLVVDRGAGLLYVALSYPLPAYQGPHAAHHALPRPGYVEALALADLRHLGALMVDPSPSGLALAADASTLLIAHDDIDRAAQLTGDIAARRASLWVVESPAAIAGNAANANALPVCAAPYAVAYGADKTRAFVTCTGEDSLAVVDPQALSVVERVPVVVPQGGVSKPYAAVADASRTRLAVSSTVSRSVTLFGMSDATPLWTRVFDASAEGVPSGVPYFAAWVSASTLLVPLQSPSGAVLLDARTGGVLRALTYAASDCDAPRQAVALDDGRAFLLCAGDGFDDGAIVAVDPASLALGARADVELAPDRMAVVLP
jgi:YVTN family beta-propeller protein